MHKRALIFVWGLAIVGLVVAGVAFAGGSGGQRVKIAQGRFAHRYWALKVEGRHHQRCYYLSLRGRAVAQSGGTCRTDRHRPGLWRQVVGIDDNNDSASVMLTVTRIRVHSMRLRIGHPRTNRPSEWIHVRNRRITPREADEANVRRNWRFAVLHSRGTLCVKRVILFNRDGARIDDQRVPCEG
jgi:hypothetical protein